MTAEDREIARTAPAWWTGADVEGLSKLAAFGAWCFHEFRRSFGDVDGGSTQDAMERLGLLYRVEVTEPCGEDCACVEYGDFPQDCLRPPAEVRAAINAATEGVQHGEAK